jgi:hypothetical protein
MKILAIETSCDETAVSLVESTGTLDSLKLNVLGDALYSQVAVHAEYGGVFPSLAKREHQRNLVPLLKKVLGREEGSKKKEVKSEIQNTKYYSRPRTRTPPPTPHTHVEHPTSNIGCCGGNLRPGAGACAVDRD